MRNVLLLLLAQTPALADGRLLRDLTPERYSIDLEVALGTSRFSGRERIEARLPAPTRRIVLHAAELSVTSATAGGAQARVSADAEAETIALDFPSELPAGAVTIDLVFAGRLNERLRGLYAARVGKDTYAFTQMEPTDARRMFPCVDEPAAKARYAIGITIDRDWQVVSNGALLETSKKGRKKTFRFAETAKMSTYLVALAIAPLAAKAAPATGAGGTPIAVHALRDKIGLSDFALEAAAALLPRLEAYFGIPYPYGKLDLVAVPEFEAGAMENAGAIFFRESALLVDPKQASAETRRRVAIIIAHEMAHMWFGDLVTMAWWDDLWLNEAFATWMEFKVVSDWKPEWNLWTDFQQMKRGPMALDALPTARAIRAEANTPAEINEMFDAITYSKGAGVLRMLELFLGEEKFRDGVRRYMAEHREGNATAADLWRALGEASGQPVGHIAPPWIEQAG
ncbi:MAG: M1 family metallopeptidase, partial [Myxococcota bacterium]